MERALIITLQSRNTLTIPHEIRKALRIEPGSALELTIQSGRLILTPVATVPRSLRLSESGEVKEAEADDDVRQGRVSEYDGVEAFQRDLDV